MTTTTQAGTEVKLETLLTWGAAKRVATRNGDRNLRTAPATEAFWKQWRENKPVLQAAGISVSKKGSDWQVCWWAPLDPQEQAARIAQHAAEEEERKRADSGELATLPAEMEPAFAAVSERLLAYQVPSARRQLKAMLDYKGAFDASDTGTGKTFVTLATAKVLNRPVFVVCPKAVMTSWARGAAHFGITDIIICNYEALREGGTLHCAVTFKMVEKKVKGVLVKKRVFEDCIWKLASDTVVVFDEAHRMKDAKTLNSQLGFAAIRQGYWTMGLTATGADNPMQMKFIALLTKQIKEEKQFFGWMLKNGVRKGRWGFEFCGGQEALHRIHRNMFPLHGTRIKISDLGDAFPETQIEPELYELNGATNEINAAYEQMANEIARIAKSEMDDSDKQACILTERLRARQRAEILKVPCLVDRVNDAIEEGMSVAVFVNFEETLTALAARLKTTSVVRGGQSQAERDAVVDAFQADKEPVILCNIKAGGVGIGLHGSPSARMRYSYVLPTDSAQDMKQAFGRVHRARGAKSIQRIFLAAGTIEEYIFANFKDKAGRIDTLNDGDMKLRGAGESVCDEQPAIVEPVTTVTLAPAQPAAARPARGHAAATTPDAVDAEAEKLSPEIIAQAHQGMKLLAEADPDRASERNGVGFSGADGEFGHKLASAERLTPRMAVYAVRLCRKYHRQLGFKFE